MAFRLDMNRLIIPVQEAADLLGMNPRNLRESIDNGTFPYGVVYKARRGKKIYKISRAKLYDFLGITSDYFQQTTN